jgi:hypothetical protein
MRYDDETWEELWERTLGHVDRHRFAVSVMRREVPDDPLGRRVVPELARRWRRTARNHLIGHVLWVLFWGSIAQAASPVQGEAWTVANGMAIFSTLVIAMLMGLRRYLEPVSRLA